MGRRPGVHGGSSLEFQRRRRSRGVGVIKITRISICERYHQSTSLADKRKAEWVPLWIVRWFTACIPRFLCDISLLSYSARLPAVLSFSLSLCLFSRTWTCTSFGTWRKGGWNCGLESTFEEGRACRGELENLRPLRRQEIFRRKWYRYATCSSELNLTTWFCCYWSIR